MFLGHFQKIVGQIRGLFNFGGGLISHLTLHRPDLVPPNLEHEGEPLSRYMFGAVGRFPVTRTAIGRRQAFVLRCVT